MCSFQKVLRGAGHMSFTWLQRPPTNIPMFQSCWKYCCLMVVSMSSLPNLEAGTVARNSRGLNTNYVHANASISRWQPDVQGRRARQQCHFTLKVIVCTKIQRLHQNGNTQGGDGLYRRCRQDNGREEPWPRPDEPRFRHGVRLGQDHDDSGYESENGNGWSVGLSMLVSIVQRC